MKIIGIKGTNLTFTESIVDTIEKKLLPLGKLTERMEPVAELQVEVGKSSKHHKKGPFWRAEATLHVPGRVLRAECTNMSLYGAIDELKDELAREIKVYKGKIEAKSRKGRQTARALKGLV